MGVFLLFSLAGFCLLDFSLCGGKAPGGHSKPECHSRSQVSVAWMHYRSSRAPSSDARSQEHNTWKAVALLISCPVVSNPA